MIQELRDIHVVMELRQGNHIRRVEILDSIGIDNLKRIGIGYVALDLEDLHRLKNDTEAKLLKQIDISELTTLLQVK